MSLFKGMSEKELAEFRALNDFLMGGTGGTGDNIFGLDDGIANGYFEIPNDLSDYLGATDNMMPDQLEEGVKRFRDTMERIRREDTKAEDEDEDVCTVGEGCKFTPVNISKTEDGKIVYIQLPLAGYTEDDIDIHLHDNANGYTLKIVGLPRIRQEDEDDVPQVELQKQFTIEPFTVNIAINEEVAKGKWNVDLGNGLLTISIFPIEPKNKSKKIF